jgi:hypothetical protein
MLEFIFDLPDLDGVLTRGSIISFRRDVTHKVGPFDYKQDKSN